MEAKQGVKEIRNNFIAKNNYGGCLNSIVQDNGNTLFEWRINRDNNELCIIEFSEYKAYVFEFKR